MRNIKGRMLRKLKKISSTSVSPENLTMPEIRDKAIEQPSTSVVLYTTSLRGIRKTFEDCKTIKFLLGSLRVVYSERDVSMHMEYRDELWRILGGRVVPPKLFIRGSYVGGADEVVGLHDSGMLRAMLHGIPLAPAAPPCRACAGVRFLLCTTCHGSRRVLANGARARCPDCNENGLVKCSLCTST
ncbi:uncharacterized protein At5g39865-like [Salvia miltiorrhiza]|uniref:uncharacterized protein At5g39865-like n=1 Tax=Salvia miltiorrhiza TaxID=226208 RepID=UPI0025AD2D69|nr:uncharacterized protein At5g39865-like [Salvia miltiorrhiza]